MSQFVGEITNYITWCTLKNPILVSACLTGLYILATPAVKGGYKSKFTPKEVSPEGVDAFQEGCLKGTDSEGRFPFFVLVLSYLDLQMRMWGWRSSHHLD